MLSAKKPKCTLYINNSFYTGDVSREIREWLAIGGLIAASSTHIVCDLSALNGGKKMRHKRYQVIKNNHEQTLVGMFDNIKDAMKKFAYDINSLVNVPKMIKKGN